MSKSPKTSLLATLFISAFLVACESNQTKPAEATREAAKPPVAPPAPVAASPVAPPVAVAPAPKPATTSSPAPAATPAERATQFAEPINPSVPTVVVNGAVGAMARGEGYALNMMQIDYDLRRKVVYYDVRMTVPVGRVKRVQISEARSGTKPILLMLDDAPLLKGSTYNTLTPNYAARSTEFAWLRDGGTTRTVFHIDIDEGNRVVRLIQPAQFSPEVKKIIFQSAS
jgi:hypothetical protein